MGVEAGDVIEREEEGHRAEEAVGHFGKHHGEGEGKLAVGFGGGFSVVDQAAEVVFGFDLGENEGGEDGSLEDDEDLDEGLARE